MKNTGIVRRIDELGRVVIPKELRRTYNIKEGDPIEFYVEGEGIILKKYVRGCLICGESKEDNKTVEGKEFCQDCIKLLNE